MGSGLSGFLKLKSDKCFSEIDLDNESHQQHHQKFQNIEVQKLKRRHIPNGITSESRRNSRENTPATGYSFHESSSYHRSTTNSFRSRTSSISPIKYFNLRVSIQHYMPATFPLPSSLSLNYLNIIRTNWDQITSAPTGRSSVYSTAENHESLSTSSYHCRSTLSFFFDDFYKRLFFRSPIFQEHISASLKSRGKLLVSSIKFVISLNEKDQKRNKKRTMALAKAHIARNIRPWMYSVFAETIVEVASRFSEQEEKSLIREAWSSVLSVVLQGMLAEVVKGNLEQLDNGFGSSQHTC